MKRRWFYGIAASLLAFFTILSGRSVAAEDWMIDSVVFDRTEFGAAVEYLAAKASEVRKAPLNVVMVDRDQTLRKQAVTLKLARVPWAEAMRYTCELAGATWRVEGEAILVGTKTDLDKLALERTRILTGPGSEANQARLGALRLERVAFTGATLAEVVDFLRLWAREKTGGNQGPPLNLLIKENVEKAVATRKIDLDLRGGVSLAELLHYATGLAECRYRVDARAVIIGEAEDLARPPGGPARPAGPIFEQLAAKRIAAIDIPAGTGIAEFLEAVRTLGGVNGIAMTREAVASSHLAMYQVSALELLRYYNEVSGTAYRLDANAFVIADDPAVTTKPKPPEAPRPVGGNDNGLGFDP